MSQVERREVIRDDYGSKHYEVIHKDGKTFVYDYGLGKFLEEKRMSTFETLGQISALSPVKG